MRSPSDTDAAPVGLRQRKKARTRAAIQAHALRLFREHGWAATTVDQIAEAAEVSQSTFFRYFPTKEDVVLHDSLDPLLLAAFREQPAELSPVAALRAALRQVRAGLPEDEWRREAERHALVIAVPELRARMLDQILTMTDLVAEAVAMRSGRALDDFAVRTITGALVGIAITSMLSAHERTDDEVGAYFDRLDAALALLEKGLPL